jgi:predicted flap endonuclease-1-like 5' DNA nuclease
MGLLAKLRSLLGRDRDAGSTPGGTPEVTVEREASETAPSPAEGEDDVASTTAEADDAETSTTAEADDAEAETGDASAPTGVAGESVESIKGIGPAYADRLAQVDVEVVGDLAEADPEEIAAETDLSAARIENWVQQARARTREA